MYVLNTTFIPFFNKIRYLESRYLLPDLGADSPLKIKYTAREIIVPKPEESPGDPTKDPSENRQNVGLERNNETSNNCIGSKREDIKHDITI